MDKINYTMARRLRGIVPAILALITIIAIYGVRCRQRIPGTNVPEDTTAALKALGVGVWLWRAERLGGPRAAAELAVSLGVDSLWIKMADGARPFGDTEELIEAAIYLRDHGVRVIAWNFTRATDPDAEARLAIEILHKPGIYGFCFDIEDIPRGAGMPDRRERLLRLLRQVRAHTQSCDRCADKVIGAAIPTMVALHPDIDYIQIAGEVQFLAPMMYWADMRMSVKECVARSFRGWLALSGEFEQRSGRPLPPILPIGQAYASGRGPRRGELTEFYRRMQGYYAASYYELGSAQSAGLLEEIRQAATLRANARPRSGEEEDG